MTNITHNNIIYLPHELKTRIHKVKKYRNGNSIEFIVENILFLELHYGDVMKDSIINHHKN